MTGIFNEQSDKLIPEFEVRHIMHKLHDMSRFDPLIDAAEEREERARLFQIIAKTLRDHIREQMFFYQRDFYRIRQLKRDLAGVCNKMDDLESRYRIQGERLRKVEEENGVLKQQKIATACKQVESMWRLEQENVALLLLQVEHLRANDDWDINHRECGERSKILEKENVELIEQLSGLSSSLVQASLELDCRSTIPIFWTMCILILNIAVVVDALFYVFF